MRFIQTSDIRLGLNTESGKRWGRDRMVERMEALSRVIEKARETSCELLMIAGALFSHQPVTSELEEVNRLFLSLPKTEIVILAGRPDILRRSSPVQSFQWAEHVHYFAAGTPERLLLPRLNAVIYGISEAEADFSKGHPRAAAISRLTDFVHADRETEGMVRILMAYEPDAKTAKTALSACSFAYAALGGMKRQEELIEDKAYYSGGLEPTDMSDAGPHGAILCDISGATGRLLRREFIPLATASYVPLAVRVTEETGQEELLKLVQNEIESRGVKNIYRIRITGKRDADVVFDMDTIRDRYRIEDCIDESEPQYDFAALFAEHPQDLIGYYISAAERERTPRSELETRALYYGIHALLKTQRQEGSDAIH